MNESIGVIDIGLGNVRSVGRMLERLGFDYEFLRRPETGRGLETLFLPGVGSFDEGMTRLRASGWDSFLKNHAGKLRIVGLCLGMQLLGESSEEGSGGGLGLLPLKFSRFAGPDTSKAIKIPHMGWNQVAFSSEGQGIPFSTDGKNPPRFYFVHSYAAFQIDEPSVIGVTTHGEKFVSASASKGTIGFQFHPEKSHQFGLELLSKTLKGDLDC